VNTVINNHTVPIVEDGELFIVYPTTTFGNEFDSTILAVAHLSDPLEVLDGRNLTMKKESATNSSPFY